MKSLSSNLTKTKQYLIIPSPLSNRARRIAGSPTRTRDRNGIAGIENSPVTAQQRHGPKRKLLIVNDKL